MTTETEVVKRVVALMRKQSTCISDRRLRGFIRQELTKDDLPGYWIRYGGPGTLPERAYMAARLERRIRKKLAQPFRRKARGPKRRKGSGKSEYKPRNR